jgi:hypothetical protein
MTDAWVDHLIAENRRLTADLERMTIWWLTLHVVLDQLPQENHLEPLTEP